MAVRIGRKYQHLIDDPVCACCDPRLRDFTARVNADLSRRGFFLRAGAALAGLGLAGAALPARAENAQPAAALFENVRVFDGSTGRRSGASNVLIVGNTIRKISADPIEAPEAGKLIKVQGGGRTLIPGLIDAHTHIMFATVPQLALLTADIGFINVAAVKAAHDMLMRGFTSIRDMGGPSFGLKRGIDVGLVPGPRIWPSGAFISQTGGHGDFRLPNEFPARPGDFTYSERSRRRRSPTIPTRCASVRASNWRSAPRRSNSRRAAGFPPVTILSM